jgi:hypothetical protein
MLAIGAGLNETETYLFLTTLLLGGSPEISSNVEGRHGRQLGRGFRDRGCWGWYDCSGRKKLQGGFDGWEWVAVEIWRGWVNEVVGVVNKGVGGCEVVVEKKRRHGGIRGEGGTVLSFWRSDWVMGYLLRGGWGCCLCLS